MYIFNRVRRFFKMFRARTIRTKDILTPILYEPYDKNTTYYIVNNNTFHIYNTEELYKLYTTTKKDPFTREPIRKHEIVRVLLKQ